MADGPPGPHPALRVERLDAGYGPVRVVRELGLEVGAGEVVAVLGPNGAGKTTTLNTIAGVVPPLGGAVWLGDADVAGAAAHAIARRGLALVPQDRGLFHQLTVRENLKLNLRSRRAGGFDHVLDHFPALGQLLGRRCGLLSGGEQQMLALARALLLEPRVLIVDEMSLGLAPVVVERLLPLLRRLAHERHMALLLVEQQVAAALRSSDRAYVMNRGRVVLSGRSADLLAEPDRLARTYLGTEA